METFDRFEKEIILQAKSTLIENLKDKLLDFPKHLEVFLKDNGVLSGGSISSIFWKETPNDYDIYLKSESDVKAFQGVIQSDEYHHLIKDVDEKYMDTLKNGKLITVNATTFKNGIQVITMNDVSQRLEFDFIHCMPWMSMANDTLYISREQYDSIRKKTLVKNPNYKMHLSNKRISKYTERGWSFKKTE
jgi:hypothetical protein